MARYDDDDDDPVPPERIQNLKLLAAIVLAIACVILAVVMRSNAGDWANVKGYISADKREIYKEMSWFLLGLGGLIVVACVHNWTSPPEKR